MIAPTMDRVVLPLRKFFFCFIKIATAPFGQKPGKRILPHYLDLVLWTLFNSLIAIAGERSAYLKVTSPSIMCVSDRSGPQLRLLSWPHPAISDT
jgi:hypothetical protein